MNPSLYASVIVLWLIIFTSIHRRNKSVILRKIIEKRKSGGNTEMKTLAENFIGKECILYSFDGSHQYSGVIKEVTDGAILIEKKGELEAVNLDFVIRIREYPKGKNGKKKSIILD